MQKKYFIAKKKDLDNCEFKKFKYKGRSAILVKIEGEFRAFIDYCTHAGGPLTVENCKLKCVTHYALFDPKTGKAETLPAPKNSYLMEIALSIEREDIFHLNTIVFKKK